MPFRGANETWAQVHRTALSLVVAMRRFVALALMTVMACTHRESETTSVRGPAPASRRLDVSRSAQGASHVEEFDHGARSRILEEKMRPLLEKHTGAADARVAYDFECRDRICRIRPRAEADWPSLSDALRGVSTDGDKRRGLILSVEYHSNPHAAYWKVSDDSVASFRSELSAKIRSEVAIPCKQQHPERGDVSIGLVAVGGNVLPVLSGPIAPTPMGECLRGALTKLVDGMEVPPGALPFSSMLRLVPQ